MSLSSGDGTKSLTGRGTAMQAAGRRPSSDECFNGGEIGHKRKNCPKLHRRRQSQLHKRKTNNGTKKGGQGKYCS